MSEKRRGNRREHLSGGGQYKRALYEIVKNARNRCTRPLDQDYKNYGGRGIEFRFPSVHEAALWIAQNLGPTPSGFTLDRIDTNGHYEAAEAILAFDSEDELVKRTGLYPGDFIRDLTNEVEHLSRALANMQSERNGWGDRCQKAEAALAEAKQKAKSAAEILLYDDKRHFGTTDGTE